MMSHSETARAVRDLRDQGRGTPHVFVIVLNYNGAQMTLNCVDSVLRIDYPNFRVMMVDNASADDSVIRFKEAITDPHVELLVNDKNQGYAGGNNRGWQRLWPPAASDPSRQLT